MANVAPPQRRFNAGGSSPNILWQNADGSVAIWEMSGTTLAGGAVVANPGPSWQTIGTGDFNGDGHSDILLQSNDGRVAIWETNGTSVTSSAVARRPRTELARNRNRRLQ